MEDALRQSSFLFALFALAFGTDVLAFGEPQRVSARDLSLQPHRVYGKEIEVRLRCAKVGESRYRCAAPGVRLDLTYISNDEGRARLEGACKRPQDAARRRCEFILRFTSEGGRRDKDGLTQIRAHDDTAEIVLSGSSD